MLPLPDTMNLHDILADDSELLFRKVFEDGPVGMALVGPDYRFRLVNAKFCELLGYSAAELTTKTFLDVTHHEEMERDRQAAARLFEGRSSSYRVRKRYLRKDGGSLWMELDTTLIRDDDGAPLYAFSIVEDVALRSRREEAQRRQAHRSSDRMVDILEATPDFVATLDTDGKVIYLNAAGRRLTGRGGIDDRPPSLEDCCPEWSWRLIWDEGIPHAARHGHWSGETALVDGDGKEVPMSQVVLAHRGDSGELTGFSTVARDISGLKRAHESLQRRLRQQAIVTDLQGLALGGGSIDRLMTRTSECVAEGLEVELVELLESRLEGGGLWLRIGLGWVDDYLGCAVLCPDGDCPSGYALRCGEPVVVAELRADARFRGRRLAEEHGVVSGIAVIVSGAERPYGVLAAYSRVKRDFTSDDVTFVQAVANVLSEAILRERAERSLRDSQARFRAFMENNQALAFIRDEAGLHTYGNRRWADELGPALEKLMVEGLDDDRPDAEENLHVQDAPDGRRRYWQVVRFPLGGLSDSSSIGGFVLDVTERQEMRGKLSQAERLAAVGELAAGVAHEVNNPLGTMINCAQLLKDGERDTSLLDDIIQEGERIATIVRNLLSFAREGPSEPRPTDLRVVIERTLALVATGFQKHGVTMESRFSEQLPPVMANPQKLQQVFLNILVNAKDALLEAGHDKAQRLIVVTGELGSLRGGAAVCVRFHDNGPGIPLALRGRIFDPFVTSKRARGGTGLGMSISKSIVEEHRGTLDVITVTGEFTEFALTLPVSGDGATIRS